MESRAKLFGHPIHPMLIPFPLGLLATSVAFDAVHLLTDDGKWAEVAHWMMAAGGAGNGPVACGGSAPQPPHARASPSAWTGAVRTSTRPSRSRRRRARYGRRPARLRWQVR